jgi:hypothetical protein
MGLYLQTLRQLIKTAQVEPARKHLSILSSRLDSEKQEVAEMLALASDKTAMGLLDFLLGEVALDSKTRERLFQLTTDRAHLNFTFANLLLDHGDRSQLLRLSPLFKYILSKETNEDLLNKIIQTVGNFKLEVLIDDVAEFIFYDHMTLKTDAIKALKQINGAKALKRLEQVASTDKCDQDILDAIDVLKTTLAAPSISIEPGRADLHRETNGFEANLMRLSSNRMDKRFQAHVYFSSRSNLVAEALAKSTADLDDLDQDLVVSLLDLTARTAPPKAVDTLFRLIAHKKTTRHIRFSTYNALAAFPGLTPTAGIINGMSDPSMPVRIAAARVLDRQCSAGVVAEIKNKIESGTKAGETLVHTLLDARAASLVEALMISDTFSFMTSNYLERSASIPVIESFIQILEKRNLKSTAKKYIRLRDQKAAIKKKCFTIICSFQPYLDVYTKLIERCGHASRSFTSPQDALEAIVIEKPVAIICDLFFKNATALEFGREIREMYSPQEMPLIISSLHQGLSLPERDRKLEKAFVNVFCDFPATPGQINAWSGSA